MVIPSSEIKRKLFHNLALVYLALYAFLPRWVALTVLGAALAFVSVVEFLRLRRPELNAKVIERFGGIHREAEVLHPSGIFWTLLGVWLTMFVFPEKRIVLPALGFLSFGDTAAALGGKKWGRHRWPKNSGKTFEGSACYFAVCAAWGMLFLRWPVALLGALVSAWVEAQPLPWNDNLWTPVLGALALSVLNLVLGRH